MKKHLLSVISLGIVFIVILSYGPVSVQGHAESSGFEPGLAETALVSLSSPSQKDPLDPWSWYIGPYQYSTVLDCTGGWPAYGMGTWVGYWQNADEGHPAVNEVYYVTIGGYGIGYPCGSIYAYYTFYLPPNTSLAISQDNPIVCYWASDSNWQQFDCDFTLEQLVPGQYAIPSGDGGSGNAWPIAAGAGWEFQIPLITSTPLNNSQFNGAIRNIDAYQNPPWLYPTVPLYIWPNAPGAFTKISPVNGETGLSTTPTLTWEASSEATKYEYCYNTTNACSTWVDNGLATSKTLNGLATNTTYYWHVRAVNDTGTTYSNESNTAFWSFKTIAPPGAFDKSSPSDGATGLSTSPTLTWEASSEAASYEYCINTTNSCSTWGDNGTATSKTLSGLAADTTYYWHVRAVNNLGTTYSNGSNSAFWSFETAAETSPPGAFDKSSPSDGTTGLSTSPTLTWEDSSGATSYSYCYDTTDDDTCTTWVDNGTATSKTLSGLAADTMYYWHVRAINDYGTTYSNGSNTATWSFKTAGAASPPGDFNKSSPSDGAIGVSTAPTLSWGTSSGATSYAYCYDTTDDDTCSNTWMDNGTATSKALSGLAAGTFYYWHVRAINNDGTTYSNGSETAFWSFKTAGTISPPGAFNKSNPSDGATGRSTSLTLSWGASSGATSYSYCYDTTDDHACSNWVDIGIATRKGISGLVTSTFYYWHVRATNNVSTTYSNGSDTAFWSFKTAAPGELKPIYLPLVLKR